MEQIKNIRASVTSLAPAQRSRYLLRMISVVIPTLNAESGLPRTLAPLVPATVNGLIREVIIVDGGSEDKTREIADEAGATLVKAERGRGHQLAAGAKAAQSDWLLFLHADTVLTDTWEENVSKHVAGETTNAAAFRFALDDDTARARIMESLVSLRCAVFALPYGDQGLLISRALYDDIGGYSALPLMEDIDIIRRIGRRRLKFLKSRAITSAARYQKYGYIIRAVRNLMCVTLYLCSVKPETIRKLYG